MIFVHYYHQDTVLYVTKLFYISILIKKVLIKSAWTIQQFPYFTYEKAKCCSWSSRETFFSHLCLLSCMGECGETNLCELLSLSLCPSFLFGWLFKVLLFVENITSKLVERNNSPRNAWRKQP